MTARKKRHILLNLILVVSVIVCLLALLAHAKNWDRIKEDRLQVLSGAYWLDLPLSDIQTLEWVERLPQMEREHGFSAWAMEKGRFRDSLQPGHSVLVLVDNLRHRKIRIGYRDSLSVYLNLKDSLDTEALYQQLEARKPEFSDADVE